VCDRCRGRDGTMCDRGSPCAIGAQCGLVEAPSSDTTGKHRESSCTLSLLSCTYYSAFIYLLLHDYFVLTPLLLVGCPSTCALYLVLSVILAYLLLFTSMIGYESLVVH
jgi:hypothetical protein